jgi:parallel beta-helix repeat protein
LCEDCSTSVVGGTTYDKIQDAINATTSRATINVSGTCTENLFIDESKNFISLIGPGDGGATISSVTIFGRGITVQGFTINGPRDGIQVAKGGSAIIENNTIDTGGYGIIVALSSYAQISGNKIQNNPRGGIVVTYNSFARIGFRNNSDPSPVPNTIQGNACGVIVGSSSSAQIVGNIISSNTEDGVRVTKVSHADISSNTIDDNGRNGILVEQNSGVNLGKDEGEEIFNEPNSSEVGNGAYGLRCDTGGYADGRLGTLDGVGKKTATYFAKSCVDSLIP